ncbi:MAG: hypothetical protein AAF467_27685 [Actinomycetota bacterium]
MNRITAPLAALAITLGTILAPAAPADAALSGCASWGCAWNVNYSGGRWHGTVDDTKTDGHCVELWTYRAPNTKLGRIARSCGSPASGSAWGGGSEDSRGVRMYRTDGRYQTLVFDTP